MWTSDDEKMLISQPTFLFQYSGSLHGFELKQFSSFFPDISTIFRPLFVDYLPKPTNGSSRPVFFQISSKTRKSNFTEQKLSIQKGWVHSLFFPTLFKSKNFLASSEKLFFLFLSKYSSILRLNANFQEIYFSKTNFSNDSS